MSDRPVYRWLQPFAVIVRRAGWHDKPRPVLAAEEAVRGGNGQAHLTLIVPDDNGRLAWVSSTECEIPEGGVGAWTALIALSRQEQAAIRGAASLPNLKGGRPA